MYIYNYIYIVYSAERKKGQLKTPEYPHQRCWEMSQGGSTKGWHHQWSKAFLGSREPMSGFLLVLDARDFRIPEMQGNKIVLGRIIEKVLGNPKTYCILLVSPPLSMLQTCRRRDSSIPIHSWVPESFTLDLHDKKGPAQEGQHHLRRLNMLFHTVCCVFSTYPNCHR